MTYKEFLEMLEELELDLDSAAEALDIEISDIEAWEEEEEIPKSAEKWIKKEKVEFAELHNSNEDEDFENEDEDEDDLSEEEDLDFDERDDEEEK
jgi:nucleosome assembly protein 1-like 1